MTGHLPSRNAPLPPVDGTPPPELAVTSHDVGYTEVLLANGDRIRCHLYVHRFVYDAAQCSYAPEFRVVPEYVMAEMRAPISAIMEGAWRV